MIDVGSLEIFVILIVALIVIGPQRLPEVAQNISKWIVQIKRFIHRLREDSEIDKHIRDFRKETNLNDVGFREDFKTLTNPVRSAVKEFKKNTSSQINDFSNISEKNEINKQSDK